MALAKRFTIEPIWTGLTAVIIAGGPSLSLKQIRTIARARLAEESQIRVIAVNDAAYVAWFADWLHACDYEWWFEHIQTIHSFSGVKTTLSENVPGPWVTGYLANSGVSGFDPDPSCCKTGHSSAYQAMCIAIHAGVKGIILTGVDMKRFPVGQNHWFGEHAKHRVPDYEKWMAVQFPALHPELESRGISVINASPDTGLTAFPTGTLEEALRCLNP